MSRADIAYLILTLLIACCVVVVVLSRRFAQYQRAVLRGNRPAKPVWKPFWLP